MKTFISQIVISLLIGHVISSVISKIFIEDHKNELELEFNYHRVEMVLEGFNTHRDNEEYIWLFQCDTNTDDFKPIDDDELTLTKKYRERQIRVTFNSSAYKNDPIVKKIMWLNICEDIIQIICTLFVLVLSLKTWTNGIKSLHILSVNYLNGNFKKRVDVKGPSSIKKLIVNQHKMAKDIDLLLKRQKMIFGSLPHDIRTPLSAIQLTSDMMNEVSLNDNFLLKRLDIQVRNLNILCESSLYLLKVLSGTIPINNKYINLKKIIDKSKGCLGIDFFINHVNTDNVILSDEKLLSIVILNVLSNSIKYMKCKIEIIYQSY
ncbi:sensor histidine kinase, partial [Photobacterium kishitanii]